MAGHRMSGSIRREFLQNTGAQIYAKSVTVLSQILLLPIMIAQWGLAGFGGWLALEALRGVLVLADLGLAQVASNEMTRLVAQGRIHAARRVNAVVWLGTGLAVAALGLIGVGLSLLPLAELLNIPTDGVGPAGPQGNTVQPTTLAFTALAFTALAAAGVLFGAVGAALRANGHYWLMVATNASVDLVSALLLGLTALSGGGYLQAALGMLCAQALMFTAVALYQWRRFPWTRPCARHLDRALLLGLLRPALSYMIFAMKDLLTIQGYNLLVTVQLGPDKLTVLAAIRTLTRAGRMVAAIFVHGAEPIFARLQGAADRAQHQRAYHLLVLSGGVGTALYLAGLFAFGPSFLDWWSNGAITGWDGLLYLMGLAIAAEVLWFTLQTPLVAANRHSDLARWVGLAALVAFVSTAVLLATGGGLWAAGQTLCLMQVVILILTLWHIRKTSWPQSQTP